MLLAASCTKKLTLGDQCPAPGSPGATLAEGASKGEYIYGTSCLPCNQPIHYDDNGCPTYVTFASCGGNICIGDREFRAPVDAGTLDAGPGEEDAGDEDAAAAADAAAEEDADVRE